MVYDNWYVLPFSWPAFTAVSVSIKAFTVWASAAVSEAHLKTPPAAPEGVHNLRAFVSFLGGVSSASEAGRKAPASTNVQFRS